MDSFGVAEYRIPRHEYIDFNNRLQAKIDTGRYGYC
jgi:hypothetical protein